MSKFFNEENFSEKDSYENVSKDGKKTKVVELKYELPEGAEDPFLTFFKEKGIEKKDIEKYEKTFGEFVEKATNELYPIASNFLKKHKDVGSLKLTAPFWKNGNKIKIAAIPSVMVSAGIAKDGEERKTKEVSKFVASVELRYAKVSKSTLRKFGEELYKELH